MTAFVVALNLDGVRCLVVGAGPVGERKAAALRDAGAAVDVRAPEHDRVFAAGDCAGYRLVVAATDDGAVNDAVEVDAHRHGAWCNRADRDDGGDLAFCAVTRSGDVTVGVSTGGADPSRARAIRDEVAAVLSRITAVSP
jgi:precorrin-2 dehydrogenase/sirohydrochlorin ferrochelatase